MGTTISVVAGCDPDRLVAAAGQLQGSIAAMQAQIVAQQEALTTLAGGRQVWGDRTPRSPAGISPAAAGRAPGPT